MADTFPRDADEAVIHVTWVEVSQTTFMAELLPESSLPVGWVHVIDCGYGGCCRSCQVQSISTLPWWTRCPKRARAALGTMQFNFIVASNTQAVTLWREQACEDYLH